MIPKGVVLACLVAVVSSNVNKHWAGVSPAFAARLNGRRGPVKPDWAAPRTHAKDNDEDDKVTTSRDGKSLRNTFPFNSNARQSHDHDHAHHHGDHDHTALAAPAAAFQPPPKLVDNSRLSRQGGGDDIPLDIGSIAAAGERCIDKVVMTEETEYDDEIHCKHSYSQKCHFTYATDFEPQQEEECDETFKKRCFIEYKQRALEEKVEFCYTPLVRNCDTPGPTECTTEYQSQCTTRYHEHDVEDDIAECEETYEEKCEDVTQGYTTEQKCTKWPTNKCKVDKVGVKKYSPETECKKVPFQLCGPSACPVEPGAEQCQEKKETIVQDVPEESCSLEPQRECKHVTKLVPLLKPRENCIDIPKEVCGRRRTNPRKVQKPVIKKWCYTSLGPKDPNSTPKPPPSNLDKCKNGQPPPCREEPFRPPVVTCSNFCKRQIRAGICDPACTSEPACPRCTPKCSSKCERDNRNGVCNPECNLSECPPCQPPRPPKCSSKCERDNRNGKCSPRCNVPECPPCQSSPPRCSSKCERDNRNGKCNPQCNVPECPPCRSTTPPPPKRCTSRCQQYIRNGDCRPECKVPECPPCRSTTPPPPKKCTSRCQQYIRNGDCRPECNVPECPPCRNNTPPPPKRCTSRCQQYIRNGDCRPECNVPECPPCRGTPPPPTCSSQCKQYIRNGDCRPECTSNPLCPPCDQCARDSCVRKANDKSCDIECINNPCGNETKDCEKPPTTPHDSYLPPGPTTPRYGYGPSQG